jgi:hypothetical protein
MKIIEILKKVWQGVWLLVDFVLFYDFLTSKGILAFLSSTIGSYATVIYDAVILLALASFAFILFWLGHRYYDSLSAYFGKLRKIKSQNMRETVKTPSLDQLPFYHTVNEAPDILKMSQKEFWVMGTTAAHWSEVRRSAVIEAILERKLSCRFLLSAPNSEFIPTSKREGIIGKETSVEEIQHSMAYFLKHLKKSPELKEKTLQAKVEVRTYNLPFLHSMAISDPDDKSGIMYVESYLYDTPKGDRFLLVIKKSDQPKLFQLYVKSFTYAWKNATPMK